METNIYAFSVDSIEERKAFLVTLEKDEIVAQIKKQLPLDCCGRADGSKELPHEIKLKIGNISTRLYKEKPWHLLLNMSCYLNLCIWCDCGKWRIDTDAIHFIRFSDQEKWGAEYKLSWERATELLTEKEKHLTFKEIPYLEQDMWDLFEVESK